MRIRYGSLALVLAACAHATVIVSVSSTSQQLAVSAQIVPQVAYATGWTQTGTYQNVSVAALLDTLQDPASGTAFLVDSIGAGTTVANQIAVAPFSVPAFVSPFSSSFTTLFSGLTLGPGTYYLVLTGTSSSGIPASWRFDSPFAVQTDAGVTSDPRVYCASNLDPVQFNPACGFPLSGYIPASAFQDLNQANSGACPTCRFSLLVTSDAAAPEPPDWNLVAAGLLFVTLTGDRWRTRRTPPSA
jgi:hypothetical protein